MIILYYGPMTKQRGLDENVQAFLYGLDIVDELRRRHPEWDFVHCEGVRRNHLRSLYRIADCVLRPTRYDGLSIMVQEALHFGLPVVHTFNVPGVILVRPDVEEIERALLSIARRDERGVRPGLRRTISGNAQAIAEMAASAANPRRRRTERSW